MTAYAQWVRYHILAEQFDRTLPGGWEPIGRTGREVYQPSRWWPGTRQEMARNARRLLRTLTPEDRRDTRAKAAAARDVAGLYGRDAVAEDVAKRLGVSLDGAS